MGDGIELNKAILYFYGIPAGLVSQKTAGNMSKN